MSEHVTTKPYEELEFRDDFMFGKTMEDPVLCHDVIECLLQRSVGELHEVQGQKQLKFTSDGKPIRLDLFNEDSEGVIYDVEMQNLGNKSITSLALPKRSRFYQSSIDIDFLNKGNHYKSLPESNILFICTFDLFGEGLAWYTFRERCDELGRLALNDGTEKHFYNCTYAGEKVPEEIRKLYDYVQTGRVGSPLTERIDEAVTKARMNEVWRTAYMKEQVLLMDAKEEGREEERVNTLRERERADRAEERANSAEERVDSAEERASSAEKRAREAEEEVLRLKALIAAGTD